MPHRTSLLPAAIVALLLPALTSGLGLHARAQDQASPRVSAAPELDRTIDAALAKLGPGASASVWVGPPGAEPWYGRNVAATRPTASAIKTFYLVELFDANASQLNHSLPGADAILADDAHPLFAPFDAPTRTEIRRALTGASVRRIGQVMMGQTDVSNAVYNAAASLVTAALGGPVALSRRIHARCPEFRDVFVRRYMLADRKAHGDNTATATAFATLYRHLAEGTLPGLDAATLAAIREVASRRTDPRLGHLYDKPGSLTSTPLTETRAGWWDTPRGPIVFAVLLEQPAAGLPPGASPRLAATADDLARRAVTACLDSTP